MIRVVLRLAREQVRKPRGLACLAAVARRARAGDGPLAEAAQGRTAEAVEDMSFGEGLNVTRGGGDRDDADGDRLDDKAGGWKERGAGLSVVSWVTYRVD